MQITRVVNKYKESYDIYIGRGSVFGNPYPVKQYGRDKCIAMFEEHIRFKIKENPKYWLGELAKLKGKTLGCFCKPQRCHGDVLIKLIHEFNV